MEFVQIFFRWMFSLIDDIIYGFIPTVYEDISPFMDIKIEAMRVFESQLAQFPAARSLDAIEALARFRGATVNVRAAEAFNLIREIR